MSTDDHDQSRIAVAAVARRFGLPAVAAGQLEAFVDLLASDPHAPTSVREPPRVVDDHIADALVALEMSEVRSAAAIVDVGSGAGVPGLPLAIALPEADVFLVESVARKCEFLARAIAACRVANAVVVNGRAECWEWGSERFDVVTARAVGAPSVVAEYAAPLLRVGGTLVAWRGRRHRAAEAAAELAAAELGLEYREPVAVQPYAGAEHRHLQLILKVRPTPSSFPRRPGLAAKRPLGRRPPSDRIGQ